MSLAAHHPALLVQLRGMFFGGEHRAWGERRTDGEVLDLAWALYIDPALRAQVINLNRQRGDPPPMLGPLADLVRDRAEGRPANLSWGDLPERLRLIDRALVTLPATALVSNPLFVPAAELVA
jgi:hypothetical protein